MITISIEGVTAAEALVELGQLAAGLYRLPPDYEQTPVQAPVDAPPPPNGGPTDPVQPPAEKPKRTRKAKAKPEPEPEPEPEEEEDEDDDEAEEGDDEDTDEEELGLSEVISRLTAAYQAGDQAIKDKIVDFRKKQGVKLLRELKETQLEEAIKFLRSLED